MRVSVLQPAGPGSSDSRGRVGRRWREEVADGLKVPFDDVDADVVVPTSLFPREEWAARTIRPKLLRVRGDCLRASPQPRARVRRAEGFMCHEGTRKKLDS